MAQRLTRHNGRANKKGVYKASHNDSKFDLENAEHIDSKRTDLNVYWDCINRVPLLKIRERIRCHFLKWKVDFIMRDMPVMWRVNMREMQGPDTRIGTEVLRIFCR